MKIPFFGKKNVHEDALDTFLSSALRNAIVLDREESDDEVPEGLPLGTSKIGGKPHLPADFVWPFYENEVEEEDYPLSFIAQINLAEVSAYDKEHLLPESGLLCFFYDILSQPWGFDPADAGCARVYYFDLPAAELVETDLPADLPDDARVSLQRLSFKSKPELPSYEELFDLTDMEQFGKDFNWEVYTDAARGLLGLEKDSDEAVGDGCKLLGYADVMQNSMLMEIAMVTAGNYCGNADVYRQRTDEEMEALIRAAQEWILLAQFDSLSDEILFGDCGFIYFYIRKEDLAAGRFDRVWLCLQCG